MPFFPQHAIYPEAALLQLLSELDQPQQKTCAPRRRQPTQTFTPKFDVAEVENAYELFGELPGLEQKDLEIEFSDAQTLVIKGKTERVAPTPTPTPTPTPAAQEPQPEAAQEKEVFTDASSEKSHAATVEDDYDEADTPLATPATATAVEAPAQEEKTEAAPAPAVAQAPKPKYWVAERKVGEFARSFSFSQRIDHDGVQASLKNGILHVVVPKSQKKGKVVVSVF
jgi:HSP20 family molecular chaperone IbpA